MVVRRELQMVSIYLMLLKFIGQMNIVELRSSYIIILTINIQQKRVPISTSIRELELFSSLVPIGADGDIAK